MSYHEQLSRQINAKLDVLQGARKPLHAQWVAHEVCNDHSDGLALNEHADFWRHGGYQVAREHARRCINQRSDGTTADKRQVSLPGFDHLQDYYMVRREGDEVGIHRDDMSDDELDHKAKFYEDMGAACLSHAKEIRRFKKLRRIAS